jgi:hypothetical protein
MPLGRRQLFAYGRIAGDALEPALLALRDWQSRLMARHPGLRCGLYRRSDTFENDVTVMESYAIESPLPHDGIDAALLRHIDEEGRVLLRPWLRGTRHVEVFDALSA